MSSTEPPSGKRATARRIPSISFCETCLGIVSSLWRNTVYRATKGYLYGAIFTIAPLKVARKCYFVLPQRGDAQNGGDTLIARHQDAVHSISQIQLSLCDTMPHSHPWDEPGILLRTCRSAQTSRFRAAPQSAPIGRGYGHPHGSAQ